jgi:hypothetical protein
MTIHYIHPDRTIAERVGNWPVNMTKELVTVEVHCRICGAVTATIPTVNQVCLDQWESGASIQAVLPTLTVAEREAMITRECDSCGLEASSRTAALLAALFGDKS